MKTRRATQDAFKGRRLERGGSLSDHAIIRQLAQWGAGQGVSRRSGKAGLAGSWGLGEKLDRVTCCSRGVGGLQLAREGATGGLRRGDDAGPAWIDRSGARRGLTPD